MINPNRVVFRDDFFDDVSDELDFLLNNYFPSRRSVLMPVERGWRPQTDMYETDAEVVIIMDIAGIKTKDIRLSLESNHLILGGIRREYVSESKRKYHKMEIDFGPFERRVELPSPIDPDRVTARYSQGFLEIHLPKCLGEGHYHKEIKIS